VKKLKKRWFDRYFWFWQRKYVKDVYLADIPYKNYADPGFFTRPCSGENLVLELEDGRKFYDSMLMSYSGAWGSIPNPAFKVRINYMMAKARKTKRKEEKIYDRLLLDIRKEHDDGKGKV